MDLCDLVTGCLLQEVLAVRGRAQVPPSWEQEAGHETGGGLSKETKGSREQLAEVVSRMGGLRPSDIEALFDRLPGSGVIARE